MAQHDYVIANGTGAAVRSDLNNALAAIVSQNSGATAPATTYAFQFWADTTTGLLKLRNSANSAWITLFQLDGEWSTLPVENGTAAAPSIYFKDSGTDTGFYSPGTDQVGISTGGTARLTIDANGNLAVDTNSLYVDAANNRVGIGTSSPGDLVTISDSTTPKLGLRTGTTQRGEFRATSAITSLVSYNSSPMSFIINDGTDKTAIHIDGSQRVGIGTTPNTLLDVKAGTNQHLNIYNSGLFATGITVASANDAFSAFTPIEFRGSEFAWHNGTTQRAAIDSSGRLLVGTSTSNAPGSLNSKIQVEALDFTGSYSAVRNSADTGGPQLVLGKSRGTALNAKTVVVSGDTLGSTNFFGADGTNFIEGASIAAFVDGTPGANDMPGRLVFSTTADGASSPTERMRIRNDGYTHFTATGNRTSSNYYGFNANGVAQWVAGFWHEGTGTNAFGITVQYPNTAPNGSGNEFIACIDSTAPRFVVKSNGGINNYSGNNSNLSDEREKKNIEDLDSTWDCLKHWELKKFHYNEDDETDAKRYGVIAQQVEEHCPEVISEWVKQKAEPAKLDDEGNELEPAKEEIVRMGIKEQQMYWMAIKALQEAQVRIEALEAEVAALKAQ